MKNHCVDCCCAQSWKALGVTGYTGKSIPEHIEGLRADNAELLKALDLAAIYLEDGARVTALDIMRTAIAKATAKGK